uniref:Uncharacterized protein n=1 Tax=Ovis aries TaxID=9940 RepID=A0AC11D1I9_SHEEP
MISGGQQRNSAIHIQSHLEQVYDYGPLPNTGIQCLLGNINYNHKQNAKKEVINLFRTDLYFQLLQYNKVRTGRGTTDWFQIGKGAHQGCILSPCLFNFYAEDVMRNAELEEAQAGIKIARRNINNLRYADDTTLMAESEEELKSLLMKV